jgi:hypothetical protein
MATYSSTVRLKLGLIVAAVLIAMVSLWYTNHIANRIQQQELDYLRLWTRALEYQYESQSASFNPYQNEFLELERMVLNSGVDAQESRDRLARALRWARSMPPPGETNFVSSEIVIPNRFAVPTIITDPDDDAIVSFRNIGYDSLGTVNDTIAVRRIVDRLDAEYPPIPIELTIGEHTLTQTVHYGESRMVKHLRAFPWVQLFFVALFIFVGYMGFSYVRKNEQSNLWVGMAKEAAHQLGTPISSMMGWAAVLREGGGQRGGRIADELDRDIARLQRVASRFSKIGSKPELEVVHLGAVVQNVCEYMRRRMPERGARIVLTESVPPEIRLPLNVELFEWVVENLLKNALDAIGLDDGAIHVKASESGKMVLLTISDSGRGIEKSQWKNVFRPGYSTKKRGWGLGLSLAKRIVEDYHGGRLELLSSRPGEGSTFRITLPAQV